MDDKEVTKTVAQCISDSKNSSERQERMRLNQMNREAFMNRQDMSHKIEGMSREFLPETSRTAEQFSAFMKKGLVEFGDWFSLTLPKSAPISEESARRLLNCYLENLPENNSVISFAERFSDATKIGLLESRMVLKVHGGKKKQKFFIEEGDKLQTIDLSPWHLQIDLCRSEDFYDDPTGRGLFRVHRVTRDFHHVKALAEQGVYSKAEVDKIRGDFAKMDEHDRDRDKNIPQTKRKRVVIDEFWGTLLNDDGTVYKENALCTVANEKYLIRKPVENPMWHGEEPFEVIPLMRVPFTVHHKALYDQVVPLNLALNELFNLILDGGIASVWGVKQLRMDWLSDPQQVAGGISQGKTLLVSDDAPPDAKVLEQVTEGQVPGDSLAVFNILTRQLHSASMQSDISLGNLPSRQVKATEIIESSQNHAVSLDSMIMDIEKQLGRVIRKSWLTLMQNADDLLATAVNEALTPAELFRFSRMSPAQRFAAFANNCHFKVSGLSATLQRAKEFQRIMAILQMGSQNPLLMRPMLQKFSPTKILDKLMRLLNLNPSELERDEEEMAQAGEDERFLQQFSGANQSTRPLGEPGQTSEVNEEVNTPNE